MFMKKRRNNKKWRYPTFPSNSQGCFGHPNVWYPCRCFQSVLHLKSKWDFSFFFNLAVNLTGTEWSRKEVDMMSFMVKLHANYVGNSGFSLPLPSGLGSTGLIFCDPLDRSPPGSSVPGISQARTLEWFAISFCRGSFWPKDRTCGSCIDRRIFTAAPLVEQEGSYMYYWTRVWLLATKPLELWLVGRKVCFIWLMATEGRWSPLQGLTPLNLIVRGKSFYRECKGGPCRNSTVNSDCHLEIGHWWSD